MLWRLPSHKMLSMQELKMRVWTEDLDLIS